MKTIKPMLLTILAIVCSLVGYIYYKFDTDYVIDKAAWAYQKRDYKLSSQFLSVLNDRKSAKANLYKGHIKRQSGDLFLAKKHLQKALELDTSKETASEICFNQMLNAYLEKDYSALEALLLNSPPTLFETHLFQALVDSHHKDFQSALNHYNQLASKKFYSDFMETDFHQYFSTELLTELKALAMIECKMFSKARKLIEDAETSHGNLSPKFHFIMGQSFLKEGEPKPISLAIPYYKTAFEYFRRIPDLDPNFVNYKVIIQTSALNLLEALLDQSMYHELSTFVDTLAYFDHHIEDVAQLFFNHICQKTSLCNKQELWTLTREVLSFCSHSAFKAKIQDALYFYLEDLSKKRDLETMEFVWPIYKEFATTPQEDLSKLAHLMIESLHDSLALGDALPQDFENVLSFLEQSEVSKEHYASFLQSLSPFLKEVLSEDDSKTWERSHELDAGFIDFDPSLFQDSTKELLNHLKGEVNICQDPIIKAFEATQQPLQSQENP